MSGVTSSRWFWTDWQGAPDLRLCSYAAKGLWMDMLAIAASHDPVGYVAVAGKGLDASSIARLTGGGEEEVKSLMDQLETNGVFSRDRRGVIYCRRMVKDAKNAAKSRDNGKLGGNPTLGNNKGISSWDNPHAKIPDNPQRESTLSTTTTVRPETTSVKKKNKEEGREAKPSRPPRGTRISADWKPSLMDQKYAAQKGFLIHQVERMAERFRDYWLAASGANALKADWPATWRNWVNRDAERLPGQPGAPPGHFPEVGWQ